MNPQTLHTPDPSAIERELFDVRRFPVLSPHGRALLLKMRCHAQAPLYRDFSGHRLDAAAIGRVRQRSACLLAATVTGQAEPPSWLLALMARLRREVPAWHGIEVSVAGFRRIRPISRADLSARLSQFVPGGMALGRMICFTTSGTTGHPLRVPSLPEVAAEYFAYHRRALAAFGIVPRAGRGEVGIVLAGHQRRCFSYVSVNPLMDECGIARINLNETAWRDPAHRAAYLDALAPELVSGDPVSLSELAALPLRHAPRALLSTSMSLHAGLREALQRRFGCPVLDLYSMNEVGPIGVFDPRLGGFRLLQPQLYVEILDEEGAPVAPGDRGEVVVSGGFNPCLPLLRYRTGDHARLVHSPAGPLLCDLAGRAPVRFVTAGGRRINNVDVTQALMPLALRRFALHQAGDRSLTLRADGAEPVEALAPALRAALEGCFRGELPPLAVHPLRADDKVRQYTSEIG